MEDCKDCVHFDDYPDFDSPCAACCGKMSNTDNFKDKRTAEKKERPNAQAHD